MRKLDRYLPRTVNRNQEWYASVIRSDNHEEVFIKKCSSRVEAIDTAIEAAHQLREMDHDHT